MKKLLTLAVIGAIVAASYATPAKAVTVFMDNFNSYGVGTDPNTDPANPWLVFGGEHTGRSIEGDGMNNWLNIDFNSVVGQGPVWVPFGLNRDSQFAPGLDLIGKAVYFSVRSSLPLAVPQVLSAEIVARVQDEFGTIFDGTLGNPDLGYVAFRYLDGELKSLPGVGDGWQGMSFLSTKFRNPEAAWQRPVLSDVKELHVLALQTASDVVGAGDMDIDNIHISSVPEPSAMMLCGFASIFGYFVRKRVKK